MIRSRTTRKVRVRLYLVLPAVRRMVLHWNLDEPAAVLLGQHGNEAVHLAVEGEGLGQVAAHGAQRAAHVLDGHSGHLADQPVAQEAGYLANEEMILPIGAEAKDGIVALGQLVEQARNVGRIVLQVTVHGDEHVTTGPVDAGLERGGLAEVAPQLHDLHARIGRQLLHDSSRAVRAAIVHEHNFIGQTERIEDAPQTFMQRPQIVPFVLDRNHHR